MALTLKRYLKYGRSTALVLHINGWLDYHHHDRHYWLRVDGPDSHRELFSDFNIHSYFAIAVTIMVISLPILGFASIIVGQC